MKDGYVLHTISKADDEGWHSFTRHDKKRGVKIDYFSKEPLQVQIPVSEEEQAECLENYSTKLGGETFKGLVGAIGRFALHDLESLFGSMKGDLNDNETLDDETAIRARCMAWIPWQGSGRGSRKPSVSKAALEGLSDAEKVQKLIELGIIK